jgi:predicted RNA binding protein YcfA (HicA-like mRNA interferase family)
MDRIKKLIQQMGVNPRNVRFPEARRVLEAYGWAVDNIVGSHYTFLKGKRRVVLVKPHGGHKTLHPKDVKKVLHVIEEQ